MNNTIFNAIQNRSKLRFTYKDSMRLVEPYTYGCNFKGNDVLRAFQIDGDTQNEWKLFSVDKIELLEESNSFALNRDSYTRGDSAMQNIYIEI